MKKFLVYGLSNDWGGVESIVMSIISKLCDSHQFDIIVSNKSCSYEESYKHPNVHFIHMISWGENAFKFSKSLKKLYQCNCYDYVWINGCIMANRTIISTTKKYSTAKIITHSHGSSFEGTNKLKRFILLALHKLNRPYYKKNVDYPCMCSHKSGLWFYGEDYVQKHYVHHIKNGIDVAKFRFDEIIRSKYRTDLGLADEFAIFHAGRLTEVKNQRRILSILAYLLDAGVNTRLFIAGEGELREELEKQTQQLHIESKVHFLGKRDDVNSIYQAMDVMLLPSFHEGFPVTLVEAQTSGLGCIVSTGVPREANISGKVKYIDLNEPDSVWASEINKIYNTINRADSYKTIIDQGYDIDTVAKDFEKHILNN